MKLALLLSELLDRSKYELHSDIDVRGIEDNSLKVKEGYAFVAIKGYKMDGHQFIEDAIEKGASVIFGERDLTPLKVPYIRVENSRKFLAKLTGAFYEFPYRKHKIIGITGTNGKTTTSFMLKHFLEKAGYSCALFGSVQNYVNGHKRTALNTTPSPIHLNQMLAESKDEYVIMEVSSHGISQDRVEGIYFDYCLFTNLTHDHLDYHKSMEDYFLTKAVLFKQLKKSGTAVINTQDEWGDKLKSMLDGSVNILTFGDLKTDDLQLVDAFTDCRTTALLRHGDDIVTLMPTLPGEHNVYNAALAYLTARKIGVRKDKLLQSLKNFSGVPGRFEFVESKGNPTVIIDYGHTPDAIFHCLTTGKDCGARKIFHVFGFRGDRDQTKRPEMIRISAEISDRYFLTTDNLNETNLEKMVQELNILQAENGNQKGEIVSDRTLAIKKAWNEAKEGDWIFITGKGLEKYEELYTLKTENDRQTVELLINN
ncbi:UDP-N-acetylmuramoyl-L-alanyl-D-glutamate--2,6-diaminopimelate ligase [Metabacillus arenae]|uniref:UDP-N-acetylmuramyl-tripeptide synthetase n=1 Tax=Metabacillus arenae TaxID=2771434 RepID=A0A926NH81_9BACI|nr:UDP-N-acetylmuramoyl-L-alanyl-D-glutamate--2,6-diaminopimelate ligase [Metabacillus arenae]MBD1380745.1 UDP-N-acetylmuramoyl-L-alanyl-D-glutamate--2,6-diaminopimelate ligase [Metabacillus arenae]